MFRRGAIIIGLALLAGCATDAPAKPTVHSFFGMPPRGQFANGEALYKLYLNDKMIPVLDQRGIPANVRKDLVDCSWLAFWDHLTPEEKAAFDAEARGEQEMPDAIATSVNNKFAHTFDKQGGSPKLLAYCPDRAEEFKAQVQ